MIDRFEDMRTFVAVVENRSFGGASEQLGVVKSAVLTTYQLLRHSRVAGRAEVFGAGWRCGAGRA